MPIFTNNVTANTAPVTGVVNESAGTISLIRGSHVSAIAIGDSLTSRSRYQSTVSSSSAIGMWNWANWLIGAPFVFRANMGISGDVTRSVMSRISAIPRDVGVVFLMTGTNDVLSMSSAAVQGTIDSTYTNVSGYLTTGVAALVAAGKKVVLSTIIPNDAYSADTDSRIQLLDRLNTHIATLASANVFVVDAFDALWDSAQPPLRVCLTNTMHSDGTHIAATGALLIGTAAMSAAKLAYASVGGNYQLYDDFSPAWQLYSGFRSGTGGTAAVKTHGTGNLADGWRSINNAGTATFALDNTDAYSVSADYVGPWAGAPAGIDEHWQEFDITSAVDADNPRLRLPASTSIVSSGTFPDTCLGGDLFFAEIDVWVTNPVNLKECTLKIQGNWTAGTSPADQPYLGTTTVQAQCGTVGDSASSTYAYPSGFRAVYRTPVLRMPENINTTAAQNLDFNFDMVFNGTGSANVKLGRPRIWHKMTGFVG